MSKLAYLPFTLSARLTPSLSIPLIGFGTWELNSSTTPPGTCKNAVLEAIKSGIRHIDTAPSYGTDKEVGEALRECGVPREQLFVTSKLYQTFHRREDVPRALDRALEGLGLGYVDLFLLHFPHAYVPGPNYEVQYTPDKKHPLIDYPLSRDYISVWKEMEKLVDTGKVRALGVSNFNILKMKKLLAAARIRPVVNQVEMHPYLPQKALLEFHRKEGIHTTAHSPLGGAPYAAVALNAHNPGPLHDPTILALAEKYSCQPSQILLSWAIQRGTSIVPKSAKSERIWANSRLFNLEEEDFAKVEGLRDGKEQLRMNDPKRLLGFDIYDEENDQPVEENEGKFVYD